MDERDRIGLELSALRARIAAERLLHAVETAPVLPPGMDAKIAEMGLIVAALNLQMGFADAARTPRRRL